jgi:hypothetical protein
MTMAYIIIEMYGGLPEDVYAFKSKRGLEQKMNKIAVDEQAKWDDGYLKSNVDHDAEFYTWQATVQ